jgi:hypothetical protein
MMQNPTLLALLITFALTATAPAEDWARFRGPDGQGISAETIPLTWSKDKNVTWTFALPGEGSSSPIVVAGRVFVTCYSGSGADAKRHIVCLDADSGEELWQDALDGPKREDDYRGYLTEHGYASGTPVSDGKNVFAFFGKAGVAGWTVDGKKLWHKDLGQMSSNREWGSGSSPVLFGNILIVNASEESRAIIGLNAETGEELWKAEYNRLELCYATPVLTKGEGDVMEAVISMPGEVWGLNATSGKIRWFCEIDNGGNVSPSVVVGEDAFYTFGGYPTQQTNAIRRPGRKDITETHRIWQARDSSYVPTPLLFENHLYWVNDRGQSFVVNAETGETVTRERLRNLKSGGRAVYASPIKSGNHLYVVTRRSGTYVFEATPEMKQVATSDPLDESDFNATPAISGGKIYLRSNEAIYCVK